MSTLLLLLPDIIIDVLLLLLLLHMMVAAVVIMQLCTILLAVSAMVNSCACTIRVTTAPTSTFTLPIGHAKNERNSITCLTSIADPPVQHGPFFAVVV
jgi:Na+-transporting NADH:ubiquinone oxidoreductase subunit NqrF